MPGGGGTGCHLRFTLPGLSGAMVSEQALTPFVLCEQHCCPGSGGSPTERALPCLLLALQGSGIHPGCPGVGCGCPEGRERQYF